MKVLLLPVFFLVAPSLAFAQASETDQIERFVKAYEQTWQSHDANQLANFFAADADMIIGIQPRAVGRAAIEASWDRYFSRLDDGRRLSISIESIRILDPDVALVNVDTTTAGTHSVSNEALEARTARGTWVVTRSGGDWTIAALRAHSPVGRLRETPGTDR
jgi:uncharacterized protein (TIGR02246 family)